MPIREPHDAAAESTVLPDAAFLIIGLHSELWDILPVDANLFLRLNLTSVVKLRSAVTIVRAITFDR